MRGKIIFLHAYNNRVIKKKKTISSLLFSHFPCDNNIVQGYKFELIEKGPTSEPLCQVILGIRDLDQLIFMKIFLEWIY
jgi:hypothetical protein